MANGSKKWYSWYFDINLLYRILIGLALGIILGLLFKEKILWIAPFGDLFVRLLKMIMMPVILATLIVGASSISPATLGKVGLCSTLPSACWPWWRWSLPPTAPG